MSVAAAQALETRLPDELTTILARRSVRAAYQPIVDLETGETVAFEALARGPEGSPLENPAALFGNVDPASMALGSADRTRRIGIEDADDDGEGAGRLRIVMEITEQALTS